MKNKNILISGASVAGPSLAFWLRQYGFNPTLVEQAPAPRPGGQAVDVRGVGRDVSERMGIMDDIRKAHTGAQGMSFVNVRGKRVASMGADLLGDSGGPIAEIEILRGDLVSILYAKAKDSAEFIFSDSIVGMVQRDHGVEVSFDRGAPRIFDLVVGADGLHSNVRSMVFGPEKNFLKDLGAYISIFSATAPLSLDGWQLMYSMPGKNKVRGKTAAIYPIRGSASSKAMFFFASPVLDYDRRNIDQQKRILADTFAGEGWEIPRLLETMWSASDFYFDRGCQIKMYRWSKGRVVLLGDAAHCASPLAGNGTSMAMVGAYVLAGELAESGGDYAQAFERYEQQMRNYVQLCQAFAEDAPDGLLPKSRFHIWMRNQFIRTLPYTPWKGMMSAGLQKAANAIKLKPYREEAKRPATQTGL